MVGKKWLQLIKSLHQKKYRNEHQLFFVEGKKVVEELLGAGFDAVLILAYPELGVTFGDYEVTAVSPKMLKTVSALKNPNGILAVFKMPTPKKVSQKGWTVVLDDVRDPGNLGTIIRLCDWFGIAELVCSTATVDVYNPKVLQATMGSVARVNVRYTPLAPWLKAESRSSYGAFMNGTNVYTDQLPESGVLVLGNEGKGISDAVTALMDKRITIPQFGGQTAESLNVAMATGILLSEIKRSV